LPYSRHPLEVGEGNRGASMTSKSQEETEVSGRVGFRSGRGADKFANGVRSCAGVTLSINLVRSVIVRRARALRAYGVATWHYSRPDRARCRCLSCPHYRSVGVRKVPRAAGCPILRLLLRRVGKVTLAAIAFDSVRGRPCHRLISWPALRSVQ
jgi:hypothetical protein